MDIVHIQIQLQIRLRRAYWSMEALSMFECPLVVKGDGQGGNGRFKKDQTAPVSRFMVDNTYLYTQVKQHILHCKKCDPTEALRFYLNRRLTLDKFQPQPGKTWPIAGMVTGSLTKLALSYERLCAKTRPIPKELVDEFIWRSGDPNIVCPNEHRLSIRELVASAEIGMTGYIRGSVLITGGTLSMNWRKIPESSKFGKICVLVQNHARPETEQEFEDLCSIMEVQCA